MSYKKILLLLILVSIIGFGFGLAIAYPEKIGLCEENDNACIYSYPVFSVAEPLVLGMPALFLIAVIFVFLRKDFFDSWKKFAIWWIPLSIILIAVSPSSSGGGFGLDIGFDKELTTWWMAGLFFAISLIIIIVKSIRLSRRVPPSA